MLLPRLYPILDASFAAAWPAARAVQALARAGCTLVQIRAKELSSRDFHVWALEAVEAARPSGVSIIVNDRADVALLVGAAGVHLGQEDLSPRAARKLLGPEAIIGLSTHSAGEAEEGGREPVDYLAIGPVFPTGTKEKAEKPVGLEGVREVRKLVAKPLVAIGGITLQNGRSVLEAGAASLAVISALMQARDLEARAREILANWAGEEGVL